MKNTRQSNSLGENPAAFLGIPIMRRASSLIVAVVVLSAVSSFARANDSSPSESLGNKLLDDLKTTPLDQPPAAPAAKNPTTQDANVPSEINSLPPNTAQPVASALVPLVRVQQGMQNAQTMLAQPGIDTHAGNVKLANSVQQEVVSELDKLIAELSKKCQCCGGGQCNKPPQPGDCDKPGQPKPGSKPGSATVRSQSPAHDSNDRLDRTNSQPVDKGDIVDAVKRLWGQLPERSRAQMLQSFSDEFLPKYEQEIEQYYRQLSAEGAKNSSGEPIK